jgi:hypothetical protein
MKNVFVLVKVRVLTSSMFEHWPHLCHISCIFYFHSPCVHRATKPNAAMIGPSPSFPLLGVLPCLLKMLYSSASSNFEVDGGGFGGTALDAAAAGTAAGAENGG